MRAGRTVKSRAPLPASRSRGCEQIGIRVKKPRVTRILIVDDDPSIRFMLQLMLEHAGYEVLEAQHGLEALKRLDGDLPDLVVTDLMMPVMGGSELVHRIRSDARTASLPILVVSGNPDALEVASSADSVIAKPFQPADLLAMVLSLLRKGATA